MNPAAMTLALRLARQRVQDHVRSQGQRLSELTMAERFSLARAYLKDHPELIEEAQARYASIIAPSR